MNLTIGITMEERLRLTCPVCLATFEVDLNEILRQKKVIYRSSASLPKPRASQARPAERTLQLVTKCPNGHPVKFKVSISET